MNNVKYKTYLKKISNRNVTKLFEAYNWMPLDEFSEASFRVYYKYIDNLKYEVLLPKADAKEKKGYSNLILDAIGVFSLVEGFSENEIIRKIASPDSNIVNIRYFQENHNSSLIPGNAITSMIEGAKKMYIHSYLDLDNATRKTYRRGRLSKDVEILMNDVYFGQTEIGSYILPMYLPKGLSNENDLLDYIEDESKNIKPTTKETKAIQRMFDSMRMVTSLNEDSNSLTDLLDVNNDDFVSINFIDALSDLALKSKNANIELDIDSNSLKTDVINVLPTTMKSKHASNLKKFVNEYKKIADNDNEVVGRLFKFGTKPEMLDRENITVQIKGVSKSGNPITKNCNFIFDEEIQHTILDAIEKADLVRIIGDIEGKKLIDCTIEVL